MRFPQTEAEIASLAFLMAQGFTQAQDDFPAPPVAAVELHALLDAFNAASAATVVTEAAFREQHATKDAALGRLTEAMTTDLRYAEVAVRAQPEKLSQIGWGGRRNGATLQAPGEVRDIKIRTEGDTWLVLDWKAPVDGGGVAAYKIQRRKRDGGTWEDVATSVELEQLVSNQPRGIEFDFRVIAINKAGAGQPSATVTLVL